jgi:hypothetical protein
VNTASGQLVHTSRADRSTILEALDRNGAVVVDDLLDDDLRSSLADDMRPYAGHVDPGTRADEPNVQQFWGAQTKRFTRLATRSNQFVDVLLHPTPLDVADHLLLPTCTDYWMNTGQMMIIGPESGGSDFTCHTCWVG